MGRVQALFFSIIGVVLLLGISFSLSMPNGWLALLFGVLAFFWTGFGFAMKARARRKSGETRPE